MVLRKRIAVKLVKLFQAVPHSVLTLSDTGLLVEPGACVK